jgi:hypothetical protein
MTLTVREVTPDVDATAFLPGAQFIDAHRVDIGDAALDARQTPERLVAGFNDRHLDFRIVVDVDRIAEGRHVTCTTLVRTHNALGRAYLTLVLPFHKMFARGMMRRIADPA